MTEILVPDASGISRAAALLADGKLVCFPTETVYGLGADARNADAVSRIFAVKGRPLFNPLILHFPDARSARSFVHFDALAETLADAFWPGPLSLVLPRRDASGISDPACAGLATAAVRVPGNETALRLLRAFGGPVAAPSANRSGRISPTCPAHVLTELGTRIDALIDGGFCDVGLESTVLRTSSGGTDTVELLRAGATTTEAVEAATGLRPVAVATSQAASSPGQALSHYAPDSALRLNAEEPGDDELYLGFGVTRCRCDWNLSRRGDLSEAAANLFLALRRLDRDALRANKSIAVAGIPGRGLGAAINDRLLRAASKSHGQRR